MFDYIFASNVFLQLLRYIEFFQFCFVLDIVIKILKRIQCLIAPLLVTLIACNYDLFSYNIGLKHATLSQQWTSGGMRQIQMFADATLSSPEQCVTDQLRFYVKIYICLIYILKQFIVPTIFRQFVSLLWYIHTQSEAQFLFFSQS